MRRHSIVIGIAGALFTAFVWAADYERYAIKKIEIVDLGTLGGDESRANDINDLGQIVGWSYDGLGRQRAFIYRGDGMQDLMPGMQVESAANGINNLTHVVGEFRGRHSQELAELFDHRAAFYWEPEIFFVQLDDDVPKLKDLCDGGEVGASAKAINDAEVIVGYRILFCSSPGAYGERAVRWETYASSWQDLADTPINASYYAHNINSVGRIVGHDATGLVSKVSGGWTWMGTAFDVPNPLPVPPEWYEGGTQHAFGVNDNSRVVGSVQLWPDGEGTKDKVTRAYWWSGFHQWAATRLPIFDDTKNSTAYEIDKQEFIVGYADRQTATFLPRQKRAVVWHADFGIRQLPTLPGGTLVSSKSCEALAVNNRNESGLVQAVGYCQLNGKRRAVRWDILTSIETIAHL